MPISRVVPALLLAAGAIAAEVEVRTAGDTVVDSGSTTQLNAPAKELVLTWSGPDGRVYGPGEVVFRFDAALVRRRLEDLRRSAGIARLEYQRNAAQRRAEVDALESEQRRLRAEHAAILAAIAVGERRDPEKIALLLAQLEQARLAADIAEREGVRIAGERERGTVSQDAAEAAARAAGLARAAVAGPELLWRQAVEPASEALAIQVMRVKAQDLAARLGLGADGAEDPALGIGARIAAARSQIGIDDLARRSEVDRTEADLRQAERDVADRTPLAWIEIQPVGGLKPVARVRFAPEGRPAPEGFADAGTWSRPLDPEELVWREAGKAPPSSSGGPSGAPPGMQAGGQRPGGSGGGGGSRRRRSGGGGAQAEATSGFSGGLALIARPATWSCVVPDGRYAVRLGLGDDRDWDGAAIRIEGRRLGLPARIAPGITEQAIEVEVADGRLDVEVGDGETKALRTPGPGLVSVQDHARPGTRINDDSWTLAFLSDPRSLVVDALVPQELAPLLAPGRPAAVAGSPLSDRLRLAGIDLVRSTGERLAAEVVSVGAQSVRFTRGTRDWDAGNPADNIARELRLRPLADLRGRLTPGETVDIALRFAVPEGACALPPHLVRMDRDGAVVRKAGERADTAVEAVRVGASTVVAAVFDPARLVPPAPRTDGPVVDEQGRYRGEVVPGTRTRVSLRWLWGRVEGLVADGSQVAAGDVVLTVYNPQMEADRERTERERKAAIQNVMAAAERRRQDLVRAKGEHAGRLATEAEARIRLRRHLEPDPEGAHTVALAARRDAEERAAAQVRRDRLAGLTQADAQDLADAETAVRRAALAGDLTALDAASWELRTDWFSGQDLATAWAASVQALAHREAELEEAALQERINTLADRIAMDRAVEGDWWQAHFATNRLVKAPVSGRILFQTGWNDQARRSEKIGKEFPVWSGMTVADIVDESRLAFTAELPDDVFPRLAAGAACEIAFEAAPGRPIPAVLTDLGRAFVIPRDRLASDGQGRLVTSRRAFTVTVSFTPPEDLRARLATGAKGWLRIP